MRTYHSKQIGQQISLDFFALTYLGFLISGVERRGSLKLLLDRFLACCYLAIKAGNWQFLAQTYRVFEIYARLEARNLRVRTSVMMILVNCALRGTEIFGGSLAISGGSS